ncbi:MAG: condensation domain-containing protein, partial [Cyanobacteria bacterium P01_D01_bin.56]
MTGNNDLKQRIIALSPSQRAALAQQLSNAGTQRLVAYVVPRKAELNTHSLKEVLKSQLPKYMVPAAIVSLKTLPRTANGKIDVNALPEPQFSSSSTTGSDSPRTDAEATLAHIWQEVLKLDAIGIHDNFFELGGDSILSIQIVSRAREAGLRLAPNQLFDHPTVAELAAVVNNDAPEVVATQELVTGEVPLTPIQHWFFEQEMVALHHWHQAMVIELPEGVQKEGVGDAIAMLYTHHDALRMQFNNQQQVNADDGNPPELIEIDLSQLSDAQQCKAIAEQGSRLHSSMHLTDGGLIKTALFHRGNNQPNWLLLSAHHLVIDAVSWQILLEDLSKLLNRAAQLPEKTTSFKDWSEALINQTSTRQSEANFWFTQTEQPTIQLPRDYSGEQSPTEGTTQTVTVA